MTASMEHGTNKSDRIPSLESGDRLTRYEFERRYAAISSAQCRYSINRIISEARWCLSPPQEADTANGKLVRDFSGLNKLAEELHIISEIDFEFTDARN